MRHMRRSWSRPRMLGLRSSTCSRYRMFAVKCVSNYHRFHDRDDLDIFQLSYSEYFNLTIDFKYVSPSFQYISILFVILVLTEESFVQTLSRFLVPGTKIHFPHYFTHHSSHSKSSEASANNADYSVGKSDSSAVSDTSKDIQDGQSQLNKQVSRFCRSARQDVLSLLTVNC